MQLEVGKYYRTKDGKVVGPMRVSGDGTFAATVGDATRLWYSFGGRVYDGHIGDIVAEAQETKYTDWIIAKAGEKYPVDSEFVNLPDGSVAYRTKVEPEVETVTLYGHGYVWSDFKSTNLDTHYITFQMIDGVVLCDTVKMKEL